MKNEAERKQLLYLQGFYLEIKHSMEELEKKLKSLKSSELKSSKALGHKEKVHA